MLPNNAFADWILATILQMDSFTAILRPDPSRTQKVAPAENQIIQILTIAQRKGEFIIVNNREIINPAYVKTHSTQIAREGDRQTLDIRQASHHIEQIRIGA